MANENKKYKRSIENAGRISDEEYYNIMEGVAERNYKYWGLPNSDAALIQVLNDNTYNYRGYYNKYPNGYGNAKDHWTDEFKTVYHPTFSDESIYSGKKSQYNPNGLKGGYWIGETFIPAKYQRTNIGEETFRPINWQKDEEKNGGIHISLSKRSIKDAGRIDTSFNYANSFVDTRSDTTRKGYHEGKMSSVQSNSYHPFIDMYNAIDYYTNATNPNSPRYNPNLVTGVAPNISIKDYTKLIDYLNNINSLQKSINTDKFVKFLNNKTGKSIKRIKIKDTKIGDVYSDGYSYVDDTGREIAYIAGNKRNNKVFVESSYVDPEFRSKGLGKQMYFDFNKQVFNKYGTTLHSSPYQHQATLETSPGSGVFISPSSKLWRGLKQNNMATIQGKGLDKYYVMDIPSNITTEFKNGGIYIAPSKHGTFTSAATKHGMGVQEFASKVLRNKDSYSPAMVKKANFARNASKWNK